MESYIFLFSIIPPSFPPSCLSFLPSFLPQKLFNHLCCLLWGNQIQRSHSPCARDVMGTIYIDIYQRKKKDRMLARLCPWCLSAPSHESWGDFLKGRSTDWLLKERRRWISREVVFLVEKAMRCQGRDNQPRVRETFDASKSS